MRRVIVNLGLSKTGTTSCAKFFKDCGFKVLDCPLSAEQVNEFLLQEGDLYIGDTTISYFIKNSDVKLPEETKFIATYRKEEDWWYSFYRHFYTRHPEANPARRETMWILFGVYEKWKADKLNAIRGYQNHYEWATREMGAEVVLLGSPNISHMLSSIAGLDDAVEFPHLHHYNPKVRDVDGLYLIADKKYYPDRFNSATKQMKSLWNNREYKTIFVREKSKSELKDGGWGCKQSHVKILKDALKMQLKYIAVFEDDFTVTGNSFDIKNTELPKKFDIFYLGGSGNYLDPDNEISMMSRCLGTHAYIANGESLGKIIKAIESDLNLPVDVNIARFMEKGDIIAYGMKPFQIEVDRKFPTTSLS